MAEIKTEDAGKKKSGTQKFTKEQFLLSKKFANEADLVDALLDDGEYTISEVEKKIKDYRKGKVK